MKALFSGRVFRLGVINFTSVMGPKIAGLPVLLVLAYLGIRYCGWVLGVVVLSYCDQRRGCELGVGSEGWFLSVTGWLLG